MLKKGLLIILITLVHAVAVAQQPLHVVILGDSNTWIGGDDCDQPKGWNYWLRQACQPASMRSYARSGATWTHTERTKRNTVENIGVLGDDNVISNQIARLEEALLSGAQTMPDVVIIMAGTNDAWFRRGQLNALLAAQVEADCDSLKALLPEARIVLLTPMRSKHAGVKPIALAGDIIETTGKRLGLTTIRMDRRRVSTSDGTHTNTAGAKAMGRYVTQQLKRHGIL